MQRKEAELEAKLGAHKKEADVRRTPALEAKLEAQMREHAWIRTAAEVISVMSVRAADQALTRQKRLEVSQCGEYTCRS